MSDPAFAKCSCQSCGVHLEYPVEAESTHIACPQCGQQTQLVPPPGADVPPVAPALSIETIDAAFAGVVPPTPVSFFYRLGLLVVTVTMVVLPLIYIAMIGAAG